MPEKTLRGDFEEHHLQDATLLFGEARFVIMCPMVDQENSFAGSKETHQGMLLSLLTVCTMLAVPADCPDIDHLGSIEHIAALQICC